MGCGSHSLFPIVYVVGNGVDTLLHSICIDLSVLDGGISDGLFHAVFVPLHGLG